MSSDVIVEASSPKQEAFWSTEADVCLYAGGAGSGKLLPLDTILPTPTGWTTMGDIQVGDHLLDETGHPVRVSHVYDVDNSPELWRLTFDDGSSVDACIDHQWLTFDTHDLRRIQRCTDEFRARRRATRPKTGGDTLRGRLLAARNAATPRAIKPPPTGSIKTTREIIATLRHGKVQRANHAIPVAAALELPHADLPVDPYLLGCWLGDGTTISGQITSSDPEVHAAFAAHYAPGKTQQKPNNKSWTLSYHGLVTDLRKINVIGNKHIPTIYLRASIEQRIALLRGLMDTDGTVCKKGRISFTTTNRNIKNGMQELLVSLGIKAGIAESDAKLYGRVTSRCWDIHFTPKFPVFTLQRQLDRCVYGTRQTLDYRYIVSAEPIPSRPGRCLTVDCPSHLYLAGKDMIPTHNSYALTIDALGLNHEQPAICSPYHNALIIRKTRNELAGIIGTTKRLYPAIYPGAQLIASRNRWEFPSGAQVTFGVAEREADVERFQGLEYSYVGIDEAGLYPSDYVFRFLLGRLRSSHGLKCYMRMTSNPTRNQWLRQLFGIGPEGHSTDQIISLKLPTGETVSKRYQYIQALLWDNKKMDTAAYAAQVMQMDEKTKQAWLYGRWDAFDCVDGIIYQKEMDELRAQNRLCRVPYDPAIETDIYFDLGRDGTPEVWVQRLGQEIRIIHSFKTVAQDISAHIQHIKDYSTKNGIRVSRVVLPHDGNSKHVNSEYSTLDVMQKYLPDIDVLHTSRDKNMPLEMGISNVSRQFRNIYIDSSCTDLVESLEKYSRKYDTTNKQYTEPKHDQHSHYADAVRYVCQDDYRSATSRKPVLDTTALLSRIKYSNI